MKQVASKIVEKLKALQPWHRHAFDARHFSYQSCRFCKRSIVDVKALWKYGVRHYACDDCRNSIIAESAAIAQPHAEEKALA